MASKSHHAEWLSLLDISGPFLSPPVLERVFPQGLDTVPSDRVAKLRLAHDEWADEQQRTRPDPAIHDQWIRFVLTEILDYTPEVLQEGDGIPADLAVTVAEHDETLQPDFVLFDPEHATGSRQVRLLIEVLRPGVDLDEPAPDSSWAASPSERMAHLCRETEVRLGLVTNGEQWMLVDAPRGETSGFVSWYAELWDQEPLTLRAFVSLLGARRFFGVAEEDRLEAMLSESASYQTEVTDTLGAQVRKAVEVLVQALDRADADTGRRLLADISPSRIYEAALTVMMRLVFLFFAEENRLLPLDDRRYAENYAASTLYAQLQAAADQVGVEVLERRHDAWCRLLATFRAIHGGIGHGDLRLPAYGGSLFDPDRFPFLEGRVSGTTWREIPATPLPIDNRTVLLLLRSLQLLDLGKGRGARRLSFRALDIEQIGHVYEGLLDHTAVRATETMVSLKGNQGREPEVAISTLQSLLLEDDEEPLVEFLKTRLKKQPASIRKALAKTPPPDVVARLLTACGGDQNLLARVLPFHELIREDPWGDPVIIPEGAVYVTEGQDRRSTGTHYTPRALTEEIVRYALEPLVYVGPADGIPPEEWKLKSPSELLDLKICDPAMGSGAFLVQACRYLSERLIEAWEQIGHDGPITPEGRPATRPEDDLVPDQPDERLVYARRLIAERCLYGVDVNPLAVEMAKLSLWLTTLAKDTPFTFLDHALKCGDSLLGVHDLDQIRYFHLDPNEGKKLHSTLFDPIRHIDRAVERALELRIELEAFPVRDIRDAERKAELNESAERALDWVRLLGDLVTAAAISTAEGSQKDFELRLLSLADWVPASLGSGDYRPAPELLRQAQSLIDGGRPPGKSERRAFHWPVEFPEVLEAGGFDVMIGNPPFLGGKRISGQLGSDYRLYLVKWLASEKAGNADLVAFFFLRASELLSERGAFRFLATNTVSQGDTREVGLEQLLQKGFQIAGAWKARRWPGNASVSVSEVHIRRASWSGPKILDGEVVRRISPTLDPVGRIEGIPFRLAANRGVAFKGANLNGAGFILSAEEASDLMSANDRNREVISPYLNGRDLSRSPDHGATRWVINFRDWPLERAERFPEVLEIVRTRVKPQRDRLPDYKARVRANWWLYEFYPRELFASISELPRIPAIAYVTKTAMPALINPRQVISQDVVLFASASIELFGLLASHFHWLWTVRYASTLEDRIRYTPTDVFATFPFPEELEVLREPAEALLSARSTLMNARHIGLTDVYNLIDNAAETDPEVEQLREIQVALDSAVALAYGWGDLDLSHAYVNTAKGVKFSISRSVTVEILDRLLELNHRRHAAERIH